WCRGGDEHTLQARAGSAAMTLGPDEAGPSNIAPGTHRSPHPLPNLAGAHCRMNQWHSLGAESYRGARPDQTRTARESERRNRASCTKVLPDYEGEGSIRALA